MPGTSGRLHKTDDGGWVWSDDEMVEEYEGEEDRGKKVCTKEITLYQSVVLEAGYTCITEITELMFCI